ncbi:MAG: hypothetical protein AB7K04_17860, partial [Pseudorhodoplanes sp.]
MSCRDPLLAWGRPRVGEEYGRREVDPLPIRVGQQFAGIAGRDDAARPAALFRISPAVHAGNALPGDLSDGFEASAGGDNGLGRVQVHGRKHCQNRKFASSNICAIGNSLICEKRNNRGMTPDRETLRRWLLHHLKERGHGARRALADFLNVRLEAISRMTSDPPTRTVNAPELLRMAEFFGVAPPSRDWPNEE